jgi:hypothetical protein
MRDYISQSVLPLSASMVVDEDNTIGVVDAGFADDVGGVHDAGAAAVDPRGRPGRVGVLAGEDPRSFS